MPKYKVLKSNVFGEGWREGNIIDMDEHAARIPGKKGFLSSDLSIEDIIKQEPQYIQDMVNSLKKYKVEYDRELFNCFICDKKHKIDSEMGQECLYKING